MFFTAVNTMFIDHYREKDYEVTKPRNAVYKHKWKIHQNTVYWCHLTVAQSKELQFYHARSNAIILYNTLLAMCIEKVVVRKSGEELHTTSSDARRSFDHSDKLGGTYRETCRCEIDFRIQGLHHSAVQEHDHIRKQTV